MIAIGIGAQSTATVVEIAGAVAQIVSAADVCSATLATFEDAPFRETVNRVAQGAGYGFVALPLGDLKERSAECQTISQRSLDRFGVPSIAEAVALAAAGLGSRLIVTRLVCGNVTAAAAQSADHAETQDAEVGT